MEKDVYLKAVENTAEMEKNVPAGYQRIFMSTRGKYGAPEVFHVRNFTVEEALELGSIAPEELPIKVTDLLQKIILEKDVDVKRFYEPEVAEFMIHFYQSFYGNILKEQKYEVTDKDKEWMKNNVYGGKETSEYLNWIRGIENGQVKLHYDIDLRYIKFYSLPEKPTSKIKYKNGNFTCVFQYPRFGDTALLQRAIKEKFRAQDRQFGPLYETYKRKQDAEARLRKGENVAIDSIPYLDQDDMEAVKGYELEKTSYIISMMKGLYLVELNGEDVSEKDLSERVEIAKDPRIDFSTYQTVAENFNKLKIGPIPEIEITNPVSGELTKVDHPFRSLELLAAIKDYKPDNASIEFI